MTTSLGPSRRNNHWLGRAGLVCAVSCLSEIATWSKVHGFCWVDVLGQWVRAEVFGEIVGNNVPTTASRPVHGAVEFQNRHIHDVAAGFQAVIVGDALHVKRKINRDVVIQGDDCYFTSAPQLVYKRAYNA